MATSIEISQLPAGSTPTGTEVVPADQGAGPTTVKLTLSAIFAALGLQVSTVLAAITQAFIGTTLYPQTAGEAAAGVTPTNYAYEPGDWRRYGATGNGSSNDATAVQDANSIGGYSLAYNGTYLVNSKIQIITNVTLLGENLQSTVLQGNGLSDYLLEIGNSSGAHANLGVIERLQLECTGSSCPGLMHFQMPVSGNPPAFWKVRNILFNTSACPGLVIANAWDSEFDNLDFISCVGSGSNPAMAASLIIKAGYQNSNNLYFKGLMFEGALCGAIYTTGHSAPIWISQGKVDNGGVSGQLAAAITIAGAYGTNTLPDEVHIDHFTIAGIYGQYPISTAGSLLLGDVQIEGASGMNAAILDERAWFQLQPLSFSGISADAIGPYIPLLDLGRTAFGRSEVSINANTGAAVQSKIPAIRYVTNLTVSASAVSGSQTIVQTGLAPSVNGVYNGLYLVHNPTGTQSAGEAGARRKVVQSYTNGELYVEGAWTVTADSDWSLEYCGGHYTPIRGADTCKLDQGMTLFAVLQTGATISGTPTYYASTNATYPGYTVFGISAENFPDSTDATGYYLIDEVTGETFLIGYGVDSSGNIGTFYNRAVDINTGHTFSIVAGYDAGIREVGASWEWSFAGKRHTVLKSAAVAQGFDINNMPLWEFGSTGDPTAIAYSATVYIDASSSDIWVLNVTNGSAFTIEAPVNLQVGHRYTLVIKNASGGSLGTVTWNAIFKQAFSAPANGYGQAIDFFYDGTNLRQINTPSATPN